MAYGKGVRLWRTPDEDGEFPELTEKQRIRLGEKAMNYGMWALGNAPKTRKQLHDKMKQKNCPEDIIETTLDRLEELQLLNDTEYAESFARSKALSGKGDRRIAQDLRQKGIPQEIIEEVIGDPDPEDERERIREAAEKKLRTTTRLERRKRVDRTVGFLVRNGYSIGPSFAVVNELLNEEAELAEDDEEQE